MILPSALALSLGSACAPQGSPPARDSLLRAAPAACVLALACDDVPGLVAGLRAGPLGALWQDDVLAPLRAKLTSAQGLGLFGELFPGGPPVHELLSGVRGAALFAGDLAAGEPSAGAVVLAMNDDLSQAVSALISARFGSDDVERVDGREYAVEQGHDGEWTAAGEWIEGLVIGFGSSRELAVAWTHSLSVGLESGDAPRQGRFAARSAALRPSIELWLDAGAFIEAAFAEAGDGSDGSGALSADAVTRLTGVKGFGWASLSLEAGSDGSLAARGALELPREGLIRRWLELARPAPLGLARFAPRATIEAGFLGLDANALWRGVQELVAEVDALTPQSEGPHASEQLETKLDEIEALIGVDLRGALLENLTGEFARFVLSDELAYGAGDDPVAAIDMLMAWGSVVLPQIGCVQVVGLRDGAAMEDLIDALIGLSGADAWIVDEQVGEHWMQSLDLTELDVPASIRPCWAVLDDALLISGGTAGLRAALAQVGEPAPPAWLDDEARAKRARALVEGGAFAVTIADLPALFDRRLLRPLREVDALFDSKEHGKAFSSMLSGVLHAAPQHLDADLSQVRAWLGQALAAGERLRDGHLKGEWLSTATLAEGQLVYRTWTQAPP